MVAVRAQHDHLTAENQVVQGVGDPLTGDAVGAHVEHSLDMVAVHAVNDLRGEGPQQVPPRTRGQQQPPGLVLHGAVVGQRRGIEPNAEEAHLAGHDFTDSHADRGRIQAVIEKGVAHGFSL